MMDIKDHAAEARLGNRMERSKAIKHVYPRQEGLMPFFCNLTMCKRGVKLYIVCLFMVQ